MRKKILIVGVVALAVMGGTGYAVSATSDDSSVTTKKVVTLNDMGSWGKKFYGDPALIKLANDVKGLDPRTHQLADEQCKIVLADYDAVLKHVPMPPLKPQVFKRYLEESREAYDLACNDIGGAVLDSQIDDALDAQHEWASAYRHEFPEAKQNFVYLKHFPFG